MEEFSRWTRASTANDQPSAGVKIPRPAANTWGDFHFLKTANCVESYVQSRYFIYLFILDDIHFSGPNPNISLQNACQVG